MSIVDTSGVRTCIAGTVSEAMSQLSALCENGNAEQIEARIEAAIAELERARQYVNELRKVLVS